MPPPAPPVGVSTGPMPFLHGINWYEHCIDPTKLENNVVSSTYTVQPWIFNCPEVGSTVNHGVRFKTLACNCNTFVRAIATQQLSTETMSLKSFLYGFPKLTKWATKADIFEFLSGVTCHCMGCSVCASPPHTMVATHNQCEWVTPLPCHSIN